MTQANAHATMNVAEVITHLKVRAYTENNPDIDCLAEAMKLYYDYRNAQQVNVETVRQLLYTCDGMTDADFRLLQTKVVTTLA